MLIFTSRSKQTIIRQIRRITETFNKNSAYVLQLDNLPVSFDHLRSTPDLIYVPKLNLIICQTYDALCLTANFLLGKNLIAQSEILHLRESIRNIPFQNKGTHLVTTHSTLALIAEFYLEIILDKFKNYNDAIFALSFCFCKYYEAMEKDSLAIFVKGSLTKYAAKILRKLAFATFNIESITLQFSPCEAWDNKQTQRYCIMTSCLKKLSEYFFVELDDANLFYMFYGLLLFRKKNTDLTPTRPIKNLFYNVAVTPFDKENYIEKFHEMHGSDIFLLLQDTFSYMKILSYQNPDVRRVKFLLEDLKDSPLAPYIANKVEVYEEFLKPKNSTAAIQAALRPPNYEDSKKAPVVGKPQAETAPPPYQLTHNLPNGLESLPETPQMRCSSPRKSV